MLDFVLYTCSYGQVTVETITCVEKLHNTNHRFEWWFQTGDALISRSRSIVAYQFLKKNCAPYLIFLDGDIIFRVEDIEKLLDALNGGLDVVGGLYPVRGGAFLAQRGWNGQFHISGDLEEVQFVSTGFVGITRNILEKITKDMPVLNKGNWSECCPVFEDGKYENIFISEDWDFCNKVRQAGAKVYAHTGIQLSHLKEKIYTTREAIENMTWKPEKQDIWNDLAEYLGTKDLMPQAIATKQLADKWKDWQGTVEEFYKDPEIGQLYLYDLVGFNSATFYKEQRMAGIKNAEHLHILDIGCGIGTTLLELCWENKNLVGYDISEKALDFARFRANKLGARNVKFTSEFPEIEKFDLIIVIDTLEHIEDLRSFLLKIGSGMKEGARFYHYDCFWEHEISPMHFDHSKHINEWLKEAGLVVFDQHWCIKK
ncbi:MAG: class I SAM-dependent methyltransferase [Dehalococcoidia bacterium]